MTGQRRDQEGAPAGARPSERLARLADRIWRQRIDSDPYLRVRHGLPVTELRGFSLDVTALRGYALDEVEQEARAAGRALADLREIDLAGLSTTDRLTWRFLDHALTVTAEAPRAYWFEFPVTGFAMTPLTFYPRTLLLPFRLDSPAQADLYLWLVREYARLLHEMRVKLEGQARRGIRLPRPALPAVRTALFGLRDEVLPLLVPAADRLARLGAASGGFADRVVRLVGGEVAAGFDRLLASLGPAYEESAPEEVGAGTLPGGEEYYRYAIRLHTTLPLEPEEVHRLGVEQVATLADRMREVRSELGFSGSESDFHRRLRGEPRLFASSVEELESCYRGHVDRLTPLVRECFRVLPRAPYRVERLDRALEAVMTYGYYEQPTGDEPVGRYRYNAAGLEHRSLLGAAALIYHELVPGHHFHLARQAENTALPMIRREAADLCVFNEGWAEYAAGLGWELGLYRDPYDAYGRLAHERLVAQRLVVDTGLNALGWTLERGREYMRANCAESDAQIASELLRYSTGHPAQALGYRIGHLRIQAMRERAERALGGGFDVRDFHEAVLAQGALPLGLLEEQVDDYVAGAKRPAREA
ncbi:DUF885 domain-containing protein [Streptosporangium sp. NPDC004631]